MSNQNTPNRQSAPSGFSFGKLLTPKLRQIINFDSQPVQAGSPEVKKSGLEAYAKKNKLSLPADFSDLVLECEMELEKEEVSLDTITRLTDLYSQAMAYYEAEGSHKYKYFAKKLQDLMLKPNVKETMVREIAPAKTGEQDKELKRMRLESQISKVNTEKEAFTLVKTHEHKEKEIKRVLQGDLTSQKDRIQKKLAQRKAKSQSRAQSVTYISDDASSTTEELQGDGDKDASPKAVNKLIKIEEADEADESRYGTPPRRRNKDGQMIIYFPKGNKSLKRLFLDELKKENEEVKKARGHVRRNSENKAPVLGGVTPAAGTNKRTARAQSFTARNLVYPGLDRLRNLNSFEKEEHKVEGQEQQEVKSAVDNVVHKEEHAESGAVVEKHEEVKPKSNNIVEEADEEGSKNGSASNSKSNVEPEEVAVAEKADEVNQEGAAQEVFEEKHVDVGGSVVINDEAHVEEIVVETPVHANASEEKEPEAPVQAEEEVRQEIVQEEKEAEPVVEEQVEVEAVKENNEEEIKQEAVEEEKEPEVPVQVEEEIRQEVAQEEKEPEVHVQAEEEVRQEINQEEKEAEQEVAVEQQENKEEVVAEAEAEVVQENNEVQAEVVNEVQEEVNKEEEQREPETVAAAVEETNAEKVEEVHVEENNAPEVQQVEVAEVEQKEEIKTETENITQEQVVPEVHEEKVEETSPVVANRRTRTDSEIADEEKLKMMRKIDEEHKLLLEELVNKQTVAKEEATKQVEEKFQKKLQAMEEDMDEDEKLSMMWQKAIAKINKDKETELQKVLEALAQEQTQEVEKYKKKLQQQKMFKLAELDS